MNQSYALVGPRGWALVSLAGGALLASPFFRAPAIGNLPGGSPQVPAAAEPFGSTAMGNFATTNHQTASIAPATATSIVAEWDQRMVMGKLPSTMAAPPAKLPDWVPTPSRLDRLIAQPEPAPSHEQAIARAEAVREGKPREFRAWRSPAPERRSEQAAALSWSAPQAQPGYRPPLAQSPAASPWGAKRLPEVPPAPVANNALATNQWPDQEWPDRKSPNESSNQLPTVPMHNDYGQQIAAFDDRQPASISWPLTSAAGGRPVEMDGQGKTAFTATLRRTGTEPYGEYRQGAVENQPGAELPEPSSTPKSPRLFVYQPGLKPGLSTTSAGPRNDCSCEPYHRWCPPGFGNRRAH